MLVQGTRGRRAGGISGAAGIDEVPSTPRADHLSGLGAIDLFGMNLKQALVHRGQTVDIAVFMLNARNRSIRGALESLGKP